MRAKDALAALYADAQLIEAAGPAVLRLKLLEAAYLAQDRRLSADMREAARLVAEDLRQLIQQRPCVSLIDQRAKDAVGQPVGPIRRGGSPAPDGPDQTPIPLSRFSQLSA